jgi:hypothetical protein
MLTSLIVTPTHSPADTNGGIYYSGTNKGLPILTPAPLLQALNQYLFIKKRQQYH